MMRKLIPLFALLCLLLAGCVLRSPATAPTTQPVPTGWQELDGQRYYYDATGKPTIGWIETAEGRFYTDSQGVLQLGFVTVGEQTYYLPADGTVLSGWQTLDGKKLCFTEEGALHSGWLEQTDATYYLQQGQPMTGWQDIGKQRYFFAADGAMHTGWLEYEGDRYFFRPDGRMAKGKVQVSDTEVRYFTSTGKEVILVNPWNFMPEDYTVNVVAHNGYRVAEECLAPLKAMLSACKKAGHVALVRSSFRTHDDQIYLFENKVRYYMNKGYSREEAEKLTSKVNAIPGTSEHELGLAVDLVDRDYQKLNEKQETMPAQKWLMEHSWEYGFILRYPNDKTDVTGIIYEPWHYRYVGTELAAELHECGLCLEEYLEALTEE